MDDKKIDEILNHFQDHIDMIDELLSNSVTINQIIENALRLCTVLSFEIPKEKYIECHTTILSYLAMFEKVMTCKMSIKSEEYCDLFFKTAQFPKLVPRVYVCLLLACSSKNELLLSKVITMLFAISHPLRGILIRFTAISFFPRDSQQLPGFAFENFKEMTYFVPNLKTQRVSDISSWLSANISMSIYKNGTDREIIKNYFSTAAKFLEQGLQDLSVNVIETIFESIDRYEIVNFLDILVDYLSKVEKDEKLYHICKKIITKIDAINAFSFIIRTPFSQDFKILITNKCISENNKILITKCAMEWPFSDVLTIIFNFLGHVEFSQIDVAPPHSSTLTVQFIKTADNRIPSSSIRKILHNELKSRSEELDSALIEFIESSNYNSTDLQIIFNEPFVAQSLNFLKIIFFKMQKVTMSNAFLFKFILQSKIADSKNVFPLLAEVCDSIESIISFMRDEEDALLVIKQLCRFESISESEIDQIEARCVTDDVLLTLSYSLRSLGFVAHADNILVRVISKDVTLGSLDSRLSLYFKILNYMISSKPNAELAEKIISHITKVMENVQNPLYQITSDENVIRWKKIAEKLTDYNGSANIVDMLYLQIIEYVASNS